MRRDEGCRTAASDLQSELTGHATLACGLILTALPGCARWYDLFQRDKGPAQLDHAEAMMALPKPAQTDTNCARLSSPRPDGSPSLCTCAVGSCRAACLSNRDGARRNLCRAQRTILRRSSRHSTRSPASKACPRRRSCKEPDSLTTWQNLRFSQRIMKARRLSDGAAHLDERSPAARPTVCRLLSDSDGAFGVRGCSRSRRPQLIPLGLRPVSKRVYWFKNASRAVPVGPVSLLCR